jgi:DNA primase
VSTVIELVDRIEKATGLGRRTRPYRKGFMLCCPAHDDRNPSLNVAPGRARSFVNCYAGCSEQEILQALNIQPDDLWYAPRRKWRA